MKYLLLPDNEDRHLSFYLATEEYAARHIVGDAATDLFFTWQVRPTVICGRNQVVENEVNLRYCRCHDIDVVRRKSGGGCVYADQGNVMLSMITHDENVNMTYNRFMGLLVLLLRQMGIQATSTSHNDVMIGDRKVSGTAFYHLPGASIIHATMLFDTCMDHMLNAITPSTEKLQRKGVESVRQRITLLKDYTTMDTAEFRTMAKTLLCQGEQLLSDDDVRNIETLEQGYFY